MRNGVLWLSLVLVAISLALVGMPGQTQTAEAQSGDICKITTWDSTGHVLNEGDTVGGDGSVYVLFRVEDDAFGFLFDFLNGPAQELVQPVRDQIDALNTQLADLVASSDWTGLNLPSYDENTTSDQIWSDLQDIKSDPDYTNPASADYDDLHAASTLLDQAYQIVVEKEADEEVLREIENALKGFVDVDLVRLDSQTGSARITSHAEVTNFTWVKPAVAHLLVNPPSESHYVDHMFPAWFTDPDGNDLDSISAWLTQVAGIPAPVADAANVCGTPMDDGWGFVDLKCLDPGSFRIDIIPHDTWDNSEMLFGSRDLVCPGAVDTATISVDPNHLEVHPVGTNTSRSIISVTTYDANGDNIDGAEVRFITDNCVFVNPLAGAQYDTGMSPVEGGKVVSLWSDTDTVADANFLTAHPLQKEAGTAEVALDCSLGTPGTASITAVVPRNGADIELKATIDVVGPTAPTGLTLSLSPTSLTCGQPLQATATAVDNNGKPVSDGTTVYFTTDASSAIINGKEGGQGDNTTVDGSTAVTIAMSPSDPGPHTVIAWIVDQDGSLLTQTWAPMECSQAAVAAEAPTSMVEGINSITPPNTGDAGLVASGHGTSSHFGLVAVTAAALMAIGGLSLRQLSAARKRL